MVTVDSVRTLVPESLSPRATVLAALIGPEKTTAVVHYARAKKLIWWLWGLFAVGAILGWFVLTEILPGEVGWLLLLAGAPLVIYHTLTANAEVLRLTVLSFEFF